MMKKIKMGMIGGGIGASSVTHTDVPLEYAMTSKLLAECLMPTTKRADNLHKTRK